MNMCATPLSSNMQWYQENHALLSTMCPNQYLVIKDRSVLEAFDTMNDATKTMKLLNLRKEDYDIVYCAPDGAPLTQLRLASDEEN